MSRTTPHPYATLPPRAYWKTGVAERGSADFAGLWSPRFEFERGTRFATAGSCFAQHISRWLKANGHEWVDSERAPDDLTAAEVADGGYGVFTFRTGNIYSAALLQQWMRWALDDATPPDLVWQDGDRFCDPFRPTIAARGFTSAQAVLNARAHTLRCIRSALPRTDVLIFTLGLTEAWTDVVDGTYYPMCPGTAGGRFDPQRHRFVNLDVGAVVQCLESTFSRLRQVNPALRFLLTVSPVPLTATASGQHVMVATMHSKSVLRAAASEMVARRDDVDYFPSYELIAGFQSEGQHFEENLRTVRRTGVEHVMRHFARGLGQDIALQPLAAPVAKARVAEGADELVCEEVLLAQGAGAPAEGADICLFGDSHMGKLAQAMGRAGIAHCGGMIMKGSSWYRNHFHLDAQELFVPLESALGRRRWAEALPFFSARPQGRSRLVITNVGVHSHVATPPFYQWSVDSARKGQFGIEEALAYYRRTNKQRLQLIKALLARGLRVLVVTDPPTQSKAPANLPLLSAFETFEMVARHALLELGCEVFVPREHLAADGNVQHYFSTTPLSTGGLDWIHGNDAFYDDVVRTLKTLKLLDVGSSATQPLRVAA